MVNTPVTSDSIGNEKKREEQLVQELADAIQGNGNGKCILQGRGVTSLDEVWERWNRAGGIGKRRCGTMG